MLAQGKDRIRDLYWLYSVEKEPTVRTTILKFMAGRVSKMDLETFVWQELNAEDMNTHDRPDLLKLLTVYAGEKAMIYLAEAYTRSDSDKTKLAIVRSLGAHETDTHRASERLKLLGRILEDASATVRASAARAAWVVSREGARPILSDRLKTESDPTVRSVIRELLEAE